MDLDLLSLLPLGASIVSFWGVVRRPVCHHRLRGPDGRAAEGVEVAVLSRGRLVVRAPGPSGFVELPPGSAGRVARVIDTESKVELCTFLVGTPGADAVDVVIPDRRREGTDECE